MLKRVFNIPGDHDVFSVGRCLEMWPYFMLGFFTRKYNLLDYIRRYPAIVSVAAITFIITFFGVIEYCGYNLGRFYKLASATMLVFLLYVFSSREDMKTKLENQLALIGRYSLEVYIFHYFFLVNTNISFIQSWAMTTHNGLIELLLLVVISVTIAYLSMFAGWLFHQEKWLSRIVYGG
jgi:peptidoglycan/LPS O-acetylase OafA/YrhL